MQSEAANEYSEIESIRDATNRNTNSACRLMALGLLTDVSKPVVGDTPPALATFE